MLGSPAYERLLARLYAQSASQRSAVKQGLRNILALDAALGLPSREIGRVVHVAGTNGKGSVCHKISKAMSAGMGMKTGLFVSPHLLCFRERVQVNHECITEIQATALLQHIFSVAEKESIPATFFEIVTAMAFCHFAGNATEACVFEVGLGGRLDATNVLNPDLSIITSIGLDHTRILGDSEEAIAREKAGIMKPGKPVLVGPSTPINVLAAEARRVGSPFFTLSNKASASTSSYDEENSLVAMEALRILKSLDADLQSKPEIPKEVYSLRPAGRMEELTAVQADKPIKVLLDVAHNAPAFKRLFRDLERLKCDEITRFRVVIGMCGDKHLSDCLDTIISSGIRPNYVYTITSNHDRALPAKDLANLFVERWAKLADEPVRSDTESRPEAFSTPIEGLQVAIHDAAEAPGNEIVVVCGSLYFMGDIRSFLLDQQRPDEPFAHVPFDDYPLTSDREREGYTASVETI